MSPFKQALFNTHDVVLLITAYLCVLFSLLILTRKGKKTPSILLALFLLCHAAIPLDILINFGEVFSDWVAERAPGIFYIFSGAYWLEAPIMLWYTRSLLYKDFKFKAYDLVFLLPFAYFLFDLSSFYALSHAEKSQSILSFSLFDMALADRIQTYTRELIRFGFFVACTVEVYRYRKHIRHEFSNIEKIDFTWLNTVVIGFTILISWQLLVLVSLEMTVGFNMIVDYEALGLTGNYARLGMISMLIFFSLSHSVVFEGFDRSALQEPESKTKKVAFGEEDIQKLSHFMDAEKPYLNSDLTINELAKQADISHRQLSVIMNTHFEKNFFEFINFYRIEEAKALLKSETHKSTNVLDIMYEVGFNSKATFNTFFKKYTGMTPSQFRKS